MNHDLKSFIFSMLRVALPVLMLVATVAFVTMPYALGHHPGDQGTTAPAFSRHMT